MAELQRDQGLRRRLVDELERDPLVRLAPFGHDGRRELAEEIAGYLSAGEPDAVNRALGEALTRIESSQEGAGR